MRKPKDKCPECEGRKIIPAKKPLSFIDYRDCPTCNGKGRLERPDRETIVEECMPTLERFEVMEKQIFFPIPCPPEFSATIRIYASTMSREAVRNTIALFPDGCASCDTPLLREGELYQKLDNAKQKMFDGGYQKCLEDNESQVEEAKKQVLISVGKEVKRMDGSVYFVPDYSKYRQAIEQALGEK